MTKITGEKKTENVWSRSQFDPAGCVQCTRTS